MGEVRRWSKYDVIAWDSPAVLVSEADYEAVVAERDALLYELADLHDSIRTVYAQCPPLPVNADTCERATDTLHTLCLLVGIHNIESPTLTGGT